jgi:tRNA(adenine34) deaminase
MAMEPVLLTAGQAARKGFLIDRTWLDPNYPRHAEHMAAAIAQAAIAGAAGDVPVGAVVVDRTGQILAQTHNQKQRLGDPTAHAEVLALGAAGRSRGNWHLNDCALYVTLEPCPMCAGALVQARIGLVVFGAADPKTGAITTVGHLAAGPWSNHRPPVIGHVLADQCQRQLADWFERRRRDRAALGPSPNNPNSPTQ